MHTTCGICSDSYVKVDDDCPISCEIDDEQAIFRFGGVRSTGVSLAISKGSLARLAAISADTLRSFPSGDAGE
jgi:hypothetical protein